MTVYAPSFLPYLRDLNVITPSHVYIRSIYKYTCLKCKKKNKRVIYIYIYNLCIPSVYPLKACHLLNDASRYAKSHMNLRIPWHAGHGRAAKGHVRGSPLACATNTWEVDFLIHNNTGSVNVWVPGICGGTRLFEESYRRYKHIQVVPLYILFTQKRSIAFKHMQTPKCLILILPNGSPRIASSFYHVFSVWLAWRPLLLFHHPHMPLKGSQGTNRERAHSCQ